MVRVHIDDPSEMNVLGLFLARALERNLVVRGKPAKLRGALTVDVEGMRATVRFEPEGATVTRADIPSRTTLAGSLAVLMDALARPRLRAFLRVKIRGNPLFALRALRYLCP